METNKIQIKALSGSILGVVSIELVATLLISRNLWCPLLVVGAARLLEIVLIILLVSIWEEGMASIGLAPAKIVTGLKRGLIWSAVFGMLTYLGFAVLSLTGIDPRKLLQARPPTRPGDLALFVLIAGMVGPIAEEVFFRGVVYGFLRRWGFAVALVLSALIFLLSHGSPSRASPTHLAGGLLFAVAYEVEGSLIVPITLHCLGNMTIFALSLVP